MVLPRQRHTFCRLEEGRGLGAHMRCHCRDVCNLHNHLGHGRSAECEVKMMSSRMCPEMGHFRRRWFCDLKPDKLLRSIFMYIYIYRRIKSN